MTNLTALRVAVTIRVKSSSGAEGALVADPVTELVAVLVLVLRRDASVTVAFDVVQESAETFLPLSGDSVPGPAGQFLKPMLAIG